MLSEGPNHAGQRLSALLGNPVQQTPQPASTTTAAAATSTTQSGRSSARNSASMGYPIYEPQSQRPYTPEPEPEPEPDTLPQHPAPPELPTTPAPAHITTTSPSQSHIPSNTNTPNLATSPTLHGTPALQSPPYSSKPSFQSHRTTSSTTSIARPDIERNHTSTDPCSPFYLHPTTRTSLEVDRAGIKTLSPSASASSSASKTAIVSIHPVTTNTSNSASDLEASLSSLNPAPYPPYNSNYEKTRRERESVVVVYPGGLEGGSASSGVVAGGSKSCELLRLECERRRLGRWKRLSPRQRLGVKLLLGFWIVGGVVGLVVGLWWRFARLGLS